MNLLTRAIDAAIGKYHGLFDNAVGLVELVSARAPEHSACFVIIGIGKYGATTCHILGGEHILALGIGLALIGPLVAISNLLFDSQAGTGYRLSCCGVHHHVANLAVGLRLGDGVHVGHMIQRTSHLRLGIGLKLHQIHAHGQSLQLHRVVEQLVVGVRLKLLGLAHHGLAQQRLYLSPAFLRRWRVFDVALAVHGIHRHGQLREMAQVLQLYLLRLHRTSHIQTIM